MARMNLSKICSLVLRLFGLDSSGTRERAVLAQVQQTRQRFDKAA